MDIRTALFAWRAEHRLDAETTARLERLAGQRGEPAALARVLRAGVMVLGVIVPSCDFWGGVGEPTICVVTPSVLNALHAAIGRPVRSLPLKHQKLA